MSFIEPTFSTNDPSLDQKLLDHWNELREKFRKQQLIRTISTLSSTSFTAASVNNEHFESFEEIYDNSLQQKLNKSTQTKLESIVTLGILQQNDDIFTFTESGKLLVELWIRIEDKLFS